MRCSDPRLMTRSEPAALPDDLTERQIRVLRLLRGSMTLTEIATELSLSPNTVKTHTQAIYRKLGVGPGRRPLSAVLTGHPETPDTQPLTTVPGQ